MPIAIVVDRVRIADFCRAHHIRKLALFGSVTRSDFREQVLADAEVLYVAQALEDKLAKDDFQEVLDEVFSEQPMTDEERAWADQYLLDR